MTNRIFPLLLTALSSLSWAVVAQAGEVQQLKGTKALITVDDSDAQVGKKLYILNSEGKKIGIVEVKQVKGGKAIVELLKGRAEVGGSTQAMGGGTSTAANPQETSSAAEGPRKKSKRSMGFLAGVASNTFSMDIGPTSGVNAGSRESGKLTGMSYNLKGFADFDLSPLITIRAAAGLETLVAKGSLTAAYCGAATGDSTDCSISFNYLALEGSGHVNYLTGKTRAWVGLGYSFLIQMSAANTLPNLQTSGSTNQLLLAGTGVDFSLSKTSFIPVAIEYGMFLGTSDVKVSSIYLRAGYGFSF